MYSNKFNFTRADDFGKALQRGATFTHQWAWEKETAPQSGEYTPVDLSGFTAKMQVRKKPGSPIIIELSTANGRIILGGALGTIDLLISATDTENLIPGMYAYDIELTSDTGFVIRFSEGLFEVEDEITV